MNELRDADKVRVGSIEVEAHRLIELDETLPVLMIEQELLEELLAQLADAREVHLDLARHGLEHQQALGEAWKRHPAARMGFTTDVTT